MEEKCKAAGLYNIYEQLHQTGESESWNFCFLWFTLKKFGFEKLPLESKLAPFLYSRNKAMVKLYTNFANMFLIILLGKLVIQSLHKFICLWLLY